MNNTYTIRIWSHRSGSYRKEWHNLTQAQLPELFSEHMESHPRTSIKVTPRKNYNFILIKE